MTTHTKAIITKNQKHILSFYKGEGGARQFVKDIDRYMTFDRFSSPYRAMDYVLNAPTLLFENYKIEKYLVNELGLTDTKRLVGREWEIYCSLMKRDGAKLYEQLKAGKNPVAPKKAAAKRTVKRRV